MNYIYGYIGTTMMFLAMMPGNERFDEGFARKLQERLYEFRKAGYTKVYATSFANERAKSRPFRF